MTADAPPLEHHGDADFWCGTWRNVNLQFWAGDASLARLQALQACQRTLIAANGGMSVLAVIRVPAKIPKISDEAKQLIAAIAQEFAQKTRVSVQVVEGVGFAAAAMRAVLTTLSFIQRAPTKTVDSLQAAAAIICPLPESRFDEGALLQAVELARQQWASYQKR
jgi:hypothetical protein